jgi:mycobactin peptide synthetase MbtE
MTFQTRLKESFDANRDRTAIEQGARSLSYAEVLSKADGITAGLLERDLPTGTIVGILLADRMDIICAMIGVINARCVFVPLDGALPPYRLATMIADMDLHHIISASGEMLPDTGGDTGGLPSPERLIFGERTGGEAVAYSCPVYDGDDSIYIYFTSGSTGTPKGIVGRNASLLQFIDWEISAFSVDRESRFSQLISPYFDAFLRDVFTPLLAGGTICIPPAEDGFFSPERMKAWIEQARIHFIHCVPSVFRLINTTALSTGDFRRLRYVLLSGEKINPQELAGWYELFGERIQLVNLYGATETTMIRSFYRIQPADVRKQRIPIGFPISDTELLVVTKDLRPCGPMVAGDLYIVSEYITKGYLHAPELNKERFIKWNAGTPAERPAFRTGDRARVLPGGQIELLGREDRQIKLRGIRVELDEVEAVIFRSGWVKNAAVIVRSDNDGNDSLAAFVIRGPGCPEGIDPAIALPGYLASYLPGYSIPVDIVEVPEFPMLSNGKIDYSRLDSYSGQREIVLAANETERRLSSIWTEILGDKQISTEDQYHKIGGHSLNMMKLIARIYREFGVRISLGELFEHLTIKKQAEFIQRASRDKLYTIAKAPVSSAYHASLSQERIYYSQGINRETVSFNLVTAWRIERDYDKGKVERSLSALIERHESLRTYFRIHNGELFQYIADRIHLTIEELEAGGEEEVQETIRRFIRPFKVDEPPLFRCAIIGTAAGEKVLVLDVHHSICDGTSQVILLEEFQKVYRGEPLETLPLQYKDYAEWEYQFRLTNEYYSHREFWLSSLEGDIPVLQLPVMNLPKAGHSDEGGVVPFRIGKDSLGGLMRYLDREGITSFTAIFSIYYLFLAQLSGQEDLVVGIAASGRLQSDLENTVGMFVKTLPFRYRMDTSQSFAGFLKEMNGRLIQANNHQVYDLENIMADLNSARPLPVKGLFAVLFSFMSYDMNADKIHGGFTKFEFEMPASQTPISLKTGEDNDSFAFELEYQTALFSRQDAELLAGQFVAIARSISGDTEGCIADIIGGGVLQPDGMEEDITFNL